MTGVHGEIASKEGKKTSKSSGREKTEKTFQRRIIMREAISY
jgi:hypothetical protein